MAISATARGAMLRILGGVGDPATRIENRVGEPAANPYLYLASQIAAGLDGIAGKSEPALPSDAPYDDAAPQLPRGLMDSLTALRGDAMYAQAFGEAFIEYILTLKEAEVSCFLSEVTDWEHREYFSNF
jgi:glutamine synthetase